MDMHIFIHVYICICIYVYMYRRWKEKTTAVRRRTTRMGRTRTRGMRRWRRLEGVERLKESNGHWPRKRKVLEERERGDATENDAVKKGIAMAFLLSSC